jgi:molecular chaperone GrpE (heat shock protein)
MLSLLESEKFKNDFKNYQKQISKITDQSLKNQLENFLDKLVTLVKAFDMEHEEMIYSKSIRLGNDKKDKIIEIRKMLDKRLRDWNEANPT